MREKRTDSVKVLQYSGAQEEVVPVGSSQPQRPQVFLNITPLVKHGNALYVSCISCILHFMYMCLKLLGRCILSSKSLCSWLDNRQGSCKGPMRCPEWRHSFNKNERVCMLPPRAQRSGPTLRGIYVLNVCVFQERSNSSRSFKSATGPTI